MMFDFPDSPAIGLIASMPDGSSRVWDGMKWGASNNPPFLPMSVDHLNISNIPAASPDGSPPPGAIKGDLYSNGGFVCIAP